MSIILDRSLAADGKLKIEWARATMPVLSQIEEEFKKLAEAYNLEVEKVKELVDTKDISRDLSVNKAVAIIKAEAKISE